MSTKALEEALTLLGRTRTDDVGEAGRILTAARTELEAIRKASRDVMTIVRDGVAKVPDSEWTKDMVVLSAIAGEVK